MKHPAQHFSEAESRYDIGSCQQIIDQLRQQGGEQSDLWSPYFAARLLNLQGRSQEAETELRTLLNQALDEPLVAFIQLSLGEVETGMSRGADAIRRLRKALAYFQHAEDDYHTGQTMLALANAYAAAALNIRQVTASNQRRVPDGRFLIILVQFIYILAHLPLTLILWWHSREPILTHPQTIIFRQSEIVDIRFTQLVGRALAWYRQALAATADEGLQADSQIEQASFLLQLRNLRVARERFEGLWENTAVRENPYRLARVQRELGRIHMMMKESAPAETLLATSLATFQKVGDQLAAARVLALQAQLAMARGDVSAALAAHRQILAIYRRQNFINRPEYVFVKGAAQAIFDIAAALKKIDKEEVVVGDAEQIHYAPANYPFQSRIHVYFLTTFLAAVVAMAFLVGQIMAQTSRFFVFLWLFIPPASLWLSWLISMILTRVLTGDLLQHTQSSTVIKVKPDRLELMGMDGRLQRSIPYKEVTQVIVRGQPWRRRLIPFTLTTTIYPHSISPVEINGCTSSYQQFQTSLRSRLQSRRDVIWYENGRVS